MEDVWYSQSILSLRTDVLARLNVNQLEQKEGGEAVRVYIFFTAACWAIGTCLRRTAKANWFHIRNAAECPVQGGGGACQCEPSTTKRDKRKRGIVDELQKQYAVRSRVCWG